MGIDISFFAVDWEDFVCEAPNIKTERQALDLLERFPESAPFNSRLSLINCFVECFDSFSVNWSFSGKDNIEEVLHALSPRRIIDIEEDLVEFLEPVIDFRQEGTGFNGLVRSAWTPERTKRYASYFHPNVMKSAETAFETRVWEEQEKAKASMYTLVFPCEYRFPTFYGYLHYANELATIISKISQEGQGLILAQ